MIPATVKYNMHHDPWIVVKHKLHPSKLSDAEPLADFVMAQQGIWKAPMTAPLYNAVMGIPDIRKFKSMENYPFPSPPHIKPRHNQPITAQFLVSHIRCWCLNGMRSGKTLSVCWAIDFLIRVGVIKRVLIMAPLTIVHDVWEPALYSVAPHRRVFVASGSVDELITVCNDRRIDIIVVNHDKIKFANTAIDLAFDPDLIVTDETGDFRDPSSSRSEALFNLLGMPGITKEPRKTRRRFWPLTASPNPQKPTDVWPVARSVSPDKVSATPKEFKESVMYQPVMGHWEKRKGWKKIVQAALQPSICWATEDCIDLPPQDYVKRNVPFTPKQTKMMNELMNDGVAFLRRVDTGVVDHTVAAANAAVRLVKILQIAGGVVKDTEGKPVFIGADKRIKELVNLTNEAMVHDYSKVVVMCVYRAMQPYIQKQLLKKGYDSLIMNGSSSGIQRKAILDEWRTDNNKKVLIAHPGVTKVGLDLTESNHMIWYLPTYKAEEFIQGNARCQGEKTNDKRKTTVVMLHGSKQELYIYNRLVNQDLDQSDTVSVFRGIIDSHVKTF